MRAHFVDGQLLEASVDLPIEGGGIDAEFQVADVGDGLESPVSGHINTELGDIAFLAATTPVVDDAGGRLESRIEIGGSLATPLLQGTVRLRDGRIVYLPVGLRLDDVVLDVDLAADRSVVVEGTFRAGEGNGSVRTQAGLSDEPLSDLTLELDGEDLLLIDVPDLQARADVDIDVTLGEDRVDLTGSLAIPWARIRPASFGVDRAVASDDVVIVRGTVPEAAVVEDREPDTAMFGRLDLSLGPDVEVDIDVGEAQVSGVTVLSWNGDPLPLANGRFDLEGEFEAYGQLLTITEGSIRFTDVPADNPRLRIRAEREIYGNSQVKRAGVLVSGSAKRPSIQAYTTPETTEERALTLLVTGSDFNLEQGVGAVDFGTYVAPRLYVSYGIGLFDRENIISARFDLTDGIGLKATSGDQSSGVDLTYRFER